MAQLIIILAALALILVLVLMARGKPEPPRTVRSRNRIRRLAMQSHPAGMICLRPEKRLVSLLRKASNLPTAQPAAELVRRHHRELMQLHLDVQHGLRDHPRLPRDQQGDARMMRLCMVLLEREDTVTPGALLQGLSTWQEASPTTLRERELMPTCMRLTLTHLLAQTLRTLLRKDPAADQEMLVQRISSIIDTARSLHKSDWNALCEPHDPLHHLLMQDPSGVYPRMTSDSRRMYRQEVAYWSHAFHADEASLAQACIDLGSAAPQDDIRANAGWYLLEHQGRLTLRRHLHARWGVIRLLLHGFPLMITRAVHAAGLIAGSMLYLNSDYPLWSLPLMLGAVAPLTGYASHQLHTALRRERLPALEVPEITAQERTLILLPAVLRDPDHAAQMVHCLQVAREACPHGAVDCLLLGDFAAHPTPVGISDRDIITAADAAVHVVSAQERPFYYMQRSRAWDDRTRMYAGRAGLRGARETIDRLICEGVCGDSFDHVTFDPADLYRRYACVFLLRPDMRLAPGSLPVLIGTLFHPLNSRYGLIQPRTAIDLMRVRSRASLFMSHDKLAGLYRPDTMLSAVHALLPENAHGHALIEAHLIGHANSGRCYVTGTPSTSRLLRRMFAASSQQVRLLRWLWPWITTPEGVQCNPLSAAGLTALRQALTQWSSPLCSAGLLLFGALARSEPLVLIAALAPLIPQLHCRDGLLRWLIGLALLPQRCYAFIDACFHAAVQRFSPSTPHPTWFPVVADTDTFARESIVQGVGVVALLGVSLVPWPPSIAGCVVTALWCCMPLLPRWLDAPLDQTVSFTDEEAATLMDVGRAAWRYFADHTADLPLDFVQEEPPLGASRTTSAEGIAMYLLSCVAALELDLLDVPAYASRVSALTVALESLPVWHGLPFDRYRIHARQPADDAVIRSSDCGWFCAALMTAASAMQSRGVEQDLAARLYALADRMQLSILYDEGTSLLFREIDPATGESTGGHHELMASESLLASFVCMMRRAAPPGHITCLNRTMTGRMMLSQSGGLSEYLLPSLLLPYGCRTRLFTSARNAIHAHKGAAVMGVYGMAPCRYMDFDRRSRYRSGSFGLPALAWEPQPMEAVIAPHASALALSMDRSACGNLTRLRALSMLGRCGFFDSLDCCPAHLPEGESRALVRCWTAAHQGATLCAICNALTGGALQRYFAAIPAAEAFLPVLGEPASHHPSIP